MSIWVNNVSEFHEAMDILPQEQVPHLPDFDVRKNRAAFLKEEFDEYCTAEGADDIVGIADALADIIYIAVGTAHVYGIPMDAVWNEVHRSNMAKLWPDGKSRRNEKNKIMKPPGWKEPDLETVLLRAGAPLYLFADVSTRK